ncbi:MAG: YwaF family protein [Lachnospiraceae bacterium]|nr:YwaF family protein [Lachnospiraceae bacterium]
MYSYIHDLLSDRKGEVIFTCFGPWHLVCIGLFVALTTAVALLLRGKDRKTKEKVMGILIAIPFGLYVLDFFLMPFAYEMIDIEKLPFHVCTAMCVACFFSRRIPFLRKFRIHFALLGFLSNLIYLIYPAGLMWYQVSPWCYRVIQTLLFHGTMTIYGFVTLVHSEESVSFKTCHRDLLVITGMTLWALLGNTLYNGTAGSYSYFHNWFFVVEDPFGMFDPKISPWIMPELNIVVFFAVELVLILLFTLIRPNVSAETTAEREDA